MNNIRKKNIINNFIKKEELPYSSQAEVQLKADQIAYMALNYSLQKLLDNDLHIEKKLMLDANYNIGPKTPLSEQQLQTAVDNYTYFDGIDNIENNLSIVQKVPREIQDTIVNDLNEHMTFLLNNNIYFAGSDNGLYQSNDLSSWTKTDIAQLKDQKIIKSYCSDDDKLMFVTDKGIYMLSGLSSLLTPETLSDLICKKIYNDSKTNVMHLSGNHAFIGKTDGLYYGTLQADDDYTVTDVKKSRLKDNVSVLAVQTLSGNSENDILVGAEDGLYGSYRKIAFDDLECISANVNSYTSFYRWDDKTYLVGTTFGLFKYSMSDKNFAELKYQTTAINVVNIVKRNNIVYVCADKGLYKVNNSFNVSIAELLDDVKVNDVYADSSIIAVATDNGIYWKDVSKGMTELHRFKSFKESSIKNIIKKNDILYCCTAGGLFELQLDCKNVQYQEKDLVLKNDSIDVTTIYSDEDDTVLIGSKNGLYNKDFKLLSISKVDKPIAEKFSITDKVNRVTYFTGVMNLNDIYAVCTDNGAYILKKKANGEFCLNNMQLLPGKDIKDILFFDDVLIFVSNDGFRLFLLDAEEQTYDTAVRLADESSYQFTEYENNISRIAKVKDFIYCLDEHEICKYQIAIALSTDYTKYQNQFDGVAVYMLDYFNRDRKGIYTCAIAENKVLTYQRYEEEGKQKWKFDQLNDGSQMSKLLQRLNDLNVDIHHFEAMPASYASNAVLAASINSNDLIVIDKYADNVNRIEFDDYIAGIQMSYNSNAFSGDFKDRSVNCTVATKHSIYADSIKTTLNNALSVSSENSQTIKKMICLPYLYKKSGSAQYMRHNIYIALTDDNKLWKFSSTFDDVDRGEMEPISNTKLNFDEIVVNDMILTDDSYLDTNNIERTKTSTAKFAIGTRNGIYAADIAFQNAQFIGNFQANTSTSALIVGSMCKTENQLYFSCEDVEVATGSNRYKICRIQLNQLTSNVVDVCTATAPIAKIVAYKDNVYALSNGQICKVVDSRLQQVSPTNTQFSDLAAISNVMLTVGTTASNSSSLYEFNDNSRDFVLKQLNNSQLSNINHMFESYDQMKNQPIICFSDNDYLYRCDNNTSSKNLEYVDILTAFDIANKGPITYYIVRDCVGNALPTQLFRSDIVCTAISASFNYSYDIVYALDNFSLIKNYDETITINKIKDIHFDNIQLSSEIAEYYQSADYIVDLISDYNQVSVNVDYLYIATNHGLKYVHNMQSYDTIDIVDDDILTGDVVDVCMSNEQIYVLVHKHDTEYALKVCNYSMMYDEFVFSDIITTQTIDFKQTIYSMSYISLNDIDQNSKYLFFATSSSVYYYDMQLKVAYVGSVQTNVNCMYNTNFSMLIGKNDGLHYMNANDCTFSLVESQHKNVKHIYEMTNDLKAYVGTDNGIYTGIFNDGHTALTNITEPDKNLLNGIEVNAMYFNDNYAFYNMLQSNGYGIYCSMNVTKYRYGFDENATELYSRYGLYNIIDYSQDLIVIDKTDTTIDAFNVANRKIQTIADFQPWNVNKVWYDDNTLYAKVENNNYYKTQSMAEFSIIDDDAVVNMTDIHDNIIIDRNKDMYSFSKIDNCIFFKPYIAYATYTIYKTSDTTALIGTKHGLYMFDGKNFIQNRVIDESNVQAIIEAPAVNDMFVVPIRQFIVGAGSKLYVSTDVKLNEFVQIADMQKHNVKTIVGIYAKNNKEYVIATDVGMFRSQNLYDLVNTYQLQTIAGIRAKISEFYEQAVKDHIAKFHDDASPITYANDNIMPTDFSEIAQSWQTANLLGTTVNNDIVETVEFESDIGYIAAQYSNFTNDYDSQTSAYSWKDLSEVSYVMKNWKSKNKEICIYLPTTNTYYVSHIVGTPGCTNDFYAFKRENAENEVSGSVNDTCTTVKLTLDNDHFDIDEIYSIQINGNSLPLGIYAETSKTDDGNSAQYYHSYILPSIVTSAPMTNDKTEVKPYEVDGKICLQFKCFGTDAQAIKITAKARTYYYVKFISPGSDSGMMDIMKVQVNKTVNLSKNMFIRNGYIFKGWSTSENGMVMYTDQQSIKNLSYVDGATITLYAVWKYYVFDESTDTILHLKSNKKEFAIAYGDTCENNSTIVIDYGYVGDTTLTLQPNGKTFTISSGRLVNGDAKVIIDCED